MKRLGSKYQLYTNRYRWFLYLFKEIKDLDIKGVAKEAGFGHDQLYRKTTGYSRFSEEECLKLLNYLGLTFEEVFLQKWRKQNAVSKVR